MGGSSSCKGKCTSGYTDAAVQEHSAPQSLICYFVMNERCLLFWLLYYLDCFESSMHSHEHTVKQRAQHKK